MHSKVTLCIPETGYCTSTAGVLRNKLQELTHNGHVYSILCRQLECFDARIPQPQRPREVSSCASQRPATAPRSCSGCTNRLHRHAGNDAKLCSSCMLQMHGLMQRHPRNRCILCNACLRCAFASVHLQVEAFPGTNGFVAWSRELGRVSPTSRFAETLIRGLTAPGSPEILRAKKLQDLRLKQWTLRFCCRRVRVKKGYPCDRTRRMQPEASGWMTPPADRSHSRRILSGYANSLDIGLNPPHRPAPGCG